MSNINSHSISEQIADKRFAYTVVLAGPWHPAKARILKKIDAELSALQKQLPA